MLEGLPQKPWMADATVTKVFKALGYPDVDVRFVGGCVRDGSLDRAITDIDIATPDAPDIVVEKLEQAGLKVVPTGVSHGTVTAVADNRGFEITTLRKDTACDGRHADVEFTTDWVEDASRRDFTFNALSLRPDGTLFDPFDGVADAHAGVVRFVGDPRDRVQEDYLRILRYFRFLAHYGKEPPTADVLSVFRELRSGLDQLSAERVRTELVKLLLAPNPLMAVDAMIESGVLRQITGNETGSATLHALRKAESRVGHGEDRADWQARWVALFGVRAVPLSGKLKCSNKDQKRITDIAAAAERAPASLTPPARHHYLYEFGGPVSAAGVLVAWARAGNEDDTNWQDLYNTGQTWRPPTFPLTGADVSAQGVEEGPAIGDILTTLERQWIESGFALTTAELRCELTALTEKLDSPKK